MNLCFTDGAFGRLQYSVKLEGDEGVGQSHGWIRCEGGELEEKHCGHYGSPRAQILCSVFCPLLS